MKIYRTVGALSQTNARAEHNLSLIRWKRKAGPLQLVSTAQNTIFTYKRPRQTGFSVSALASLISGLLLNRDLLSLYSIDYCGFSIQRSRNSSFDHLTHQRQLITMRLMRSFVFLCSFFATVFAANIQFTQFPSDGAQPGVPTTIEWSGGDGVSVRHLHLKKLETSYMANLFFWHPDHNYYTCSRHSC